MLSGFGVPDPNHGLLKRLITFFHKQAVEKYLHLPGRSDVYVACGSRPADGELVKHSYHLIINSLVFSCNDNNQMKQSFTLPSTRGISSEP